MTKFPKYICIFYILAIFFVIPIYNKGTFDNLSQNKVEAFYYISGVSFVMYLTFSVFSDLRYKKAIEISKLKLKNSDIAMSLFIAANILSTIFSGRAKEAFYGVAGYGMGLLTILIMGISYYYISENGDVSLGLFHAAAIFSVIPTVLAIVNRMGFDPLHMYFEKEHIRSHLYVSTIGNYGAFGSYMSIIMPIVVFMAFNSQKRYLKVMYSLLLIMDIIAIVLAGNTSVRVIAIIATVIVLYWKTGSGIHLGPKNFVIVFFASILIYAALIVYGIRHPDFGNGRGFIWAMSIDMFKSFSLREKVFGVGPNCYMYALTDFLLKNQSYLTLCNEKFGNLVLTSAHSEYLDCLINSGLLGLFFYGGIVLVTLKTYAELDEKTSLKRLSFLCCISYFVLTMTIFPLVLYAPYFYIFFGLLCLRTK